MLISNKNEIIIKNYQFDSFFFNKRLIKSTSINFIILRGDYFEICIDGNEILFLSNEFKDKMLFYAKKNSIFIYELEDVWLFLCYSFCEFYSEDEDIKNLLFLNSIGFTNTEINKIRERISSFLTVWSTFSMENYSINHFEMLLKKKHDFIFKMFYKKFYWFTMKIAIKGYENQLLLCNIYQKSN